jgi:hypothetical protein
MGIVLALGLFGSIPAHAWRQLIYVRAFWHDPVPPETTATSTVYQVLESVLQKESLLDPPIGEGGVQICSKHRQHPDRLAKIALAAL